MIMLSRKTILVALVVLAAFGALPQLAAADPEFELHEHMNFTGSGGAANLEAKSLKVTCSTVTGSGKFEDSQAGNIEFAYHGCKTLGVNCTTAGQTAGTITVASSPFRVKSATEGKLALLITPKEEQFANFSCSPMLKVVISGNGVVGIVTSPGYGEEKSTVTLKFSGEKGTRSHKTVDGDKTEYTLKASVNGGEPAPVTLPGEIVLSFAGGVQPPPVKALTMSVAPIKDGTVLSSPIGIHCIWGCAAVF